ncbi:META domain-containing protein [Pontibacter sp. HSC-36F09]|uniref:META domain-containing protein n=1 Tax=Pontibacter sp. HSC-36F09 TaxID=2910966 RepID=UPI0020A06717|nr:META domain-containing protein [Pontibacter sp. HSC-36F09]MCP2044612.1 heat shock protein HslJ/uncharacterized membrane protein/uncharacterized lipoprotein NlpE involved in copper resistance [Pontibacter sp. HSC-36F09]
MNLLNRLLLVGILLLCIATACSTAPTSVSQSDAPLSNAEVARAAVGTWIGTIPCADCPGIRYTLDINPDSSYRERMVYQGRSATPFVQSGTWGVGNGRVQLNKQGTGNNQFALDGEALVMLDGDGNQIESPLADAYRLRRRSPDEPEDNPSLWREKYERGIDFAAAGNEPFWSLEIDLEKMIEFRLLDEEDGSVLTPIPVAEKPETGEGTIYRVQTVSGNLEIRLMKENCVNTMSGREFPYTVTVLKNDMEYKGCGMYLRDSRLNGTWNLVELEGKAIKTKDAEQNQPSLNINLDEGRVSGRAGCNRITGTLEPIGDKINFGPIAATRMACPDMELESQFLRVLNDAELRYSVSEESLELLLGGKTVAVFARGA